MARTLDKKTLRSFAQEVRGYLPQIRAHLTSLGTDSKQPQALAETYRFFHTIKGASAMVGYAVLSHLTYYVEGTVEEIMGGQRPFDKAIEAWLHRATDQIERYLDGLLSGNIPEQAIVTDVVQSFRRLKGFPEAGDAAAIEEVLAGKDEPVATAPVVQPALAEQALAGVAEAGEQAEGKAARTPETPEFPSMPLSDSAGELDALVASIDQEVSQTYGSAKPSPGAGQPLGAAVSSKETADRYVIFELAGARYAVAVASVFEVGRVPGITPVPNVPSWVRGVINLRGEILSIIDFRAFLGIAETQARDSSRMLVIKSAGEEVSTSLIVDRVVGIVQLPQIHLEPPPAPDSDRVAPYLSGVCQHQDHVLAILNLENFLLSPEVCQFS